MRMHENSERKYIRYSRNSSHSLRVIVLSFWWCYPCVRKIISVYLGRIPRKKTNSFLTWITYAIITQNDKGDLVCMWMIEYYFFRSSCHRFISIKTVYINIKNILSITSKKNYWIVDDINTCIDRLVYDIDTVFCFVLDKNRLLMFDYRKSLFYEKY